MKSLLILRLSLLLLCAANCQPQVTATGTAASESTPKSTENNIVYLFFQTEKLPDGSEKVTHTDTKITAGYLKPGSVENKERQPGNLMISMLGADGVTIEERVIEDPLNPVLESYTAEGLSKEKARFAKADFSVRFNQKGDVAAVKVEKMTPESKKHLITIKL